MGKLISCRVYVYGQGFGILMQSSARVFQAARNTATNWRALWGVRGTFIRIEEFAVVLYSSGKKDLDKRAGYGNPCLLSKQKMNPLLYLCVCLCVRVCVCVLHNHLPGHWFIQVLMKWHPELHSVILHCVIFLFISLFVIFLKCFLSSIRLSHFIFCASCPFSPFAVFKFIRVACLFRCAPHSLLFYMDW